MDLSVVQQWTEPGIDAGSNAKDKYIYKLLVAHDDD